MTDMTDIDGGRGDTTRHILRISDPTLELSTVRLSHSDEI
jgi:hypothetical protein